MVELDQAPAKRVAGRELRERAAQRSPGSPGKSEWWPRRFASRPHQQFRRDSPESQKEINPRVFAVEVHDPDGEPLEETAIAYVDLIVLQKVFREALEGKLRFAAIDHAGASHEKIPNKGLAKNGLVRVSGAKR